MWAWLYNLIINVTALEGVIVHLCKRERHANRDIMYKPSHHPNKPMIPHYLLVCLSLFSFRTDVDFPQLGHGLGKLLLPLLAHPLVVLAMRGGLGEDGALPDGTRGDEGEEVGGGGDVLCQGAPDVEAGSRSPAEE